MKISYVITVHNEADELNKLLEILVHKTQTEDEIVIVDDFSDEPTQEVISKWMNETLDWKGIYWNTRNCWLLLEFVLWFYQIGIEFDFVTIDEHPSNYGGETQRPKLLQWSSYFKNKHFLVKNRLLRKLVKVISIALRCFWSVYTFCIESSSFASDKYPFVYF